MKIAASYESVTTAKRAKPVRRGSQLPLQARLQQQTDAALCPC
jgi:hypothetical protein